MKHKRYFAINKIIQYSLNTSLTGIYGVGRAIPMRTKMTPKLSIYHLQEQQKVNFVTSTTLAKLKLQWRSQKKRSLTLRETFAFAQYCGHRPHTRPTTKSSLSISQHYF